MNLINNRGSVEDIRCSIYHINPMTQQDFDSAIILLIKSLQDEKSNRNRSTVIKMIETKLKKLQKQ